MASVVEMEDLDLEIGGGNDYVSPRTDKHIRKVKKKIRRVERKAGLEMSDAGLSESSEESQANVRQPR